jgi:tetratricopeptide (TPR) repeat protein
MPKIGDRPEAESVRPGSVFAEHRYQEAAQTFRRCLEQHPEFHYALTSMAVVHGMQGDLESARREVARTLKIDPTYTVKRFISPNLYRDKTIMDRCAEMLRSAGMPESD